jgi:Uma2 family endonuclease
VCNRDKLDDKGCKGAPNLIVEILSPSSSRMDMVVKHKLYREAGVCEYWIVSPEERYVLVNLLNDNGDYVQKGYIDDMIVQVTSLPGLEISLNDIFEDIE